MADSEKIESDLKYLHTILLFCYFIRWKNLVGSCSLNTETLSHQETLLWQHLNCWTAIDRRVPLFFPNAKKGPRTTTVYSVLCSLFLSLPIFPNSKLMFLFLALVNHENVRDEKLSEIFHFDSIKGGQSVLKLRKIVFSLFSCSSMEIYWHILTMKCRHMWSHKNEIEKCGLQAHWLTNWP